MKVVATKKRQANQNNFVPLDRRCVQMKRLDNQKGHIKDERKHNFVPRNGEPSSNPSVITPLLIFFKLGYKSGRQEPE